MPFRHLVVSGRGGQIRTGDPLHPMQVRYRAALRPAPTRGCYHIGTGDAIGGMGRISAEFSGGWRDFCRYAGAGSSGAGRTRIWRATL